MLLTILYTKWLYTPAHPLSYHCWICCFNTFLSQNGRWKFYYILRINGNTVQKTVLLTAKLYLPHLKFYSFLWRSGHFWTFFRRLILFWGELNISESDPTSLTVTMFAAWRHATLWGKWVSCTRVYSKRQWVSNYSIDILHWSHHDFLIFPSIEVHVFSLLWA